MPDAAFRFRSAFRPLTFAFALTGLSALAALAAFPATPLAAQAGASATDTAAEVTTNPDHDHYILPPESVQRLFATDENYATLDYVSPDRDHFLVPHVTELSTLELMSRPTYRLAELEIRPATDRLWHLDTWGVDGFRFYSLARRGFTDVKLPAGSFASDFTWSPDGARMAFLAHLPDHTEAWTVDAATGRTRRLSRDRVLATVATSSRGQGSRPSQMVQWTPEGTVITLLVPPDRGPEPADPAIPTGPVVRRTRPKPTPNPTWPNLLQDRHDEDLFEYYTTSQITELGAGRPRPVGKPGMYESISVSPDGKYILATRIERPFSYRTSYRGFPRTTLILDRQGRELAVLDHKPLVEGEIRGRGNGDAPRGFAWRPDGAGLSYLARAPRERGEPGAGGAPGARGAPAAGRDASRPDRVYLLRPPFDTAAAEVVAESEDPIRSVVYSNDGAHLFATVTKNGRTALAHYGLAGASPERQLLVDFYSSDDPTKLPGELLTARTGNGLEYAVVASDGKSVYLEGPGYKDDFRPQPFVDRVSLADGSTKRLFEGAKDSYDRPLVALDVDLDSMVVSREGVHDFPDSFLWTASGTFEDLTHNVDPLPEITAAKRIDFEFTNREGVKVQGRVSLPLDYKAGDKVPAIFWTYPREYEKASEYEAAAIRERNRNAFTPLSWLRWSDIWLTQGYALVYPDIPVIGENYNDTYIASLLDGMYAAIRAVDSLGVVDIDRIGHGGHSYGAFATANILANSPFFKAGIAGDGAYNRSLTPSGFQAERRSIWEAPSTYIEMSPFFKADQMNSPLLMYHGAADNNTGTFPIQSRRMIQALTSLGKTAVLYEYPFESHTPRAIENNLDLWARWLDWFDRYVKGAGKGVVAGADPTG